MNLDAVALTAAYETHKAFLWGLGYRMLGTPDDADDMLQESFVYLIEHPPAEADAQVVPWLVRVALRIARSELRNRKARDYHGSWLPGPTPTQRLEIPGAAFEARYGLAESASYAFLLALEPLDEDDRAALLLRDVFAYTVQATAAALELSDAEVEACHLRSREALHPYDETRRPLTPELYSQTEVALSEVLARSSTVRDLLADDARVATDTAGEFDAAGPPAVGRDTVAARLLQLALHGPQGSVTVGSFNGLPAAVAQDGQPEPGSPPRQVLRLELNADGKIQVIHRVLATGKLGALWGYGAKD